MSRWTVTYTKHIKQKRKVYNDGILELSGAKVLLYDDCEKLIDSRFSKKDEVVECGGMLTFDTHLVDIGDPEVSIGPSADQDAGIEDEKLEDRAGAHGQMPFYLGKKKSAMQCLPSKNDSNLAHGNIKEWNVLYTTQITQKLKRYHDGILRLVSCGSHMNQVILLNEDGAVLSSKHLKSVECVKTGQKCEFPNYLVEICVQQTPKGDTSKRPLEEVADSRSTSVDSMANTKNSCNDKSFLEDIRKGHKEEARGGVGSDSGRSAGLNNRPTHDVITKSHKEEVRGGVDSNSGRSTGLNTRPIRDATQILSSLKRPDHTLQSSDIILLNVENKNKMLEFNARKPTEDNHRVNAIAVYSNCPGKPPSYKHSTSSNRLSRLSCGPVDSTNMDKIASPSNSPVEDHIDANKNRSLTDEIVALQQEWTNLSYRVSTIGNTKIPMRFRMSEVPSIDSVHYLNNLPISHNRVQFTLPV